MPLICLTGLRWYSPFRLNCLFSSENKPFLYAQKRLPFVEAAFEDIMGNGELLDVNFLSIHDVEAFAGIVHSAATQVVNYI